MQYGSDFVLNKRVPDALDESGSHFAEVVLPEDMKYGEMVREYRSVTKEIQQMEKDLVVRGKDWWDFFVNMDREKYSESVVSFYEELNVATRLGARYFVVDIDSENIIEENLNEAFGRAFDNTGDYQRVVFDIDLYNMTDSVLDLIANASMKFGVRINTTDIVKTNVKSSKSLKRILNILQPRVMMFDVNLDLVEAKYVKRSQRNSRKADYPISNWLDYFLSQNFVENSDGFVFVPSEGISTLQKNVNKLTKLVERE